MSLRYAKDILPKQSSMDAVFLENCVLATLAYYQALGDYPLTAFELFRHLNAPDNKNSRHRGDFLVFKDIKNVLAYSHRLKELVSQKNGFYFLKNNLLKEPVKMRIERQKIAERKWKKTRKIVRWFQMVPYFRMAAVSGSLSVSNTRKESDLDLLITAKYGRVWTLRVFLTVLTQSIGQRRHGLVVKDKICLNQYLTDEFKEISPKNLSNAQSLARLVPLLGLNEFERFVRENNWIGQYLFFGFCPAVSSFRTIKENGFLKAIGRFLEFVLDTRLGDFIEKTLGEKQKNRIIAKTKAEYVAFDAEDIGRKAKKHLCLSDKGLIFHYPISRNLQVQEKYYSVIKSVKLL